MEMNDFETGFLASSRQVAHLLFGVPCRVGRPCRSAVCFFVLVLNNAPALRAGKKQLCTSYTSRGAATIHLDKSSHPVQLVYPRMDPGI